MDARSEVGTGGAGSRGSRGADRAERRAAPGELPGETGNDGGATHDRVATAGRSTQERRRVTERRARRVARFWRDPIVPGVSELQRSPGLQLLSVLRHQRRLAG